MPSARGDGRLTHALDPHDLGPQDACGVFGVWAPGEDVAKLTYYGLYALQHRGQESAGIAVGNGRQILVYKDMGLVSQVFDEATLASLKGHLAVGHARYSTTGASTWHNAQPTFRPTETNPLESSERITPAQPVSFSCSAAFKLSRLGSWSRKMLLPLRMIPYQRPVSSTLPHSLSQPPSSETWYT